MHILDGGDNDGVESIRRRPDPRLLGDELTRGVVPKAAHPAIDQLVHEPAGGVIGVADPTVDGVEGEDAGVVVADQPRRGRPVGSRACVADRVPIMLWFAAAEAPRSRSASVAGRRTRAQRGRSYATGRPFRRSQRFA